MRIFTCPSHDFVVYVHCSQNKEVQIACGSSLVNSKPNTSVYAPAVKFLSEWIRVTG